MRGRDRDTEIAAVAPQRIKTLVKAIEVIELHVYGASEQYVDALR